MGVASNNSKLTKNYQTCGQTSIRPTTRIVYWFQRWGDTVCSNITCNEDDAVGQKDNKWHAVSATKALNRKVKQMWRLHESDTSVIDRTV